MFCLPANLPPISERAKTRDKRYTLLKPTKPKQAWLPLLAHLPLPHTTNYQLPASFMKTSDRSPSPRRKLGAACLLCGATSALQSIGSPAASIRPCASARVSALCPSIDDAAHRRLAASSQFWQLQLETLQRILLPSLLASVASTLFFPPLALFLSYLIADSASFAVLSVDSSQFVQNFLTVTGLTFSILVGQTYYFMYQQQESVFNSLFSEVTEAKSLVEQVALVCQGRGDMYRVCLGAVKM